MRLIKIIFVLFALCALFIVIFKKVVLFDWMVPDFLTKLMNFS